MEIFDFEVASLSSSSSTALLVPKFVLFFFRGIRALLAAQIPSEAISAGWNTHIGDIVPSKFKSLTRSTCPADLTSTIANQ